MADEEKEGTAVALRYVSGEDRLPDIVARGSGPIAAQILQLAAQHGIPVHRDEALVSILSRLDPGLPIPAAAFAAVAEILAFLYRVDRAEAAAA